jgi:hypothetical protein
MTFEEPVDQAIAMLERRGRATYRALKRQFQLDDDVLEDLTVEIIKAQRLAVDEDGEVLVWTGILAVHGAITPSHLHVCCCRPCCRTAMSVSCWYRGGDVR